MGNQIVTPVPLFGQEAKTCKCNRKCDGSGCICDLSRHASTCSDWKIAQLVGSATYAQLLDAAPGLFEPFPDYRTDGNTTVDLPSVYGLARILRTCNDGEDGSLLQEDSVAPPPNLVSTLLVDGDVTPANLKRMLINATRCAPAAECVAPLVNSSRCYNAPSMTLAEVFAHFCILAVVISILAAAILYLIGNRWACKFAGGCPGKRVYWG